MPILANFADYGLYIQSFPSENSELSSLILENNEPIRLKEETTLSFDMFIRPDNIFGLVVRVITNRDENIDLMFTASDDSRRFPMLIVNKSIHILSEEALPGKWIPVQLTLSTKKDTITLQYGSSKLSIPHSFSGTNSARIVFGKSSFEKFPFSDVASVNLREIKISYYDKLVRYWKLKQHANTFCYDSVENIPAISINPHWIIDSRVSWDQLYTASVPENSLFAFDPDKSIFFIVPNSNEVQLFDTEQKTLIHLPVKGGGHMAANAPNQILYDSRKEALVSYNTDENLFSILSLNTLTWSNSALPEKGHRYWNNTASYSPDDSTIFTFGGYGYYKYTNELIRLRPYSTIKEKESMLSEIDPRYSSASVIEDRTLYLFGGRGCKSGRQELFPQNYYDLYAVNLTTLQVNKVWEKPSVPVDFLPGENMVYDKSNDCFYLFTILDGGTLLKLDPRKKDFAPMSKPIRENLEAHYLYTNLYYSPESNKLFALISKTKADKSTSVSIYSMPFPPTPVTDLYQNTENRDQKYYSHLWYILFITTSVICSLYYLFLRMKGKPDKQNLETEPDTNKTQSGSALPASDEASFFKNETQLTEEPHYDFSRHCICLLGDFYIRNKNGEDITEQYTPMLKQLFIILILFSVKYENGISGTKLIQTLWYDKTEESARNNRNVYLSKLRILLEKVEGIEIMNKNGAWMIQFGEGVTCDYVEAMKYFSEITQESSQSQDYLNRLLELLLRGVLLPNIETEWVDNFKSDFSSLTIDLLKRLLCDKQRRFTDDFKLRIADTIFLHDLINEEALHIKCSILYHSGKRGLAKNVYNNFCKEYHNLLDADYKRSLSDVINQSEELSESGYQ